MILRHMLALSFSQEIELQFPMVAAGSIEKSFLIWGHSLCTHRIHETSDRIEPFMHSFIHTYVSSLWTKYLKKTTWERKNLFWPTASGLHGDCRVRQSRVQINFVWSPINGLAPVSLSFLSFTQDGDNHLVGTCEECAKQPGVYRACCQSSSRSYLRSFTSIILASTNSSWLSITMETLSRL